MRLFEVMTKPSMDKIVALLRNQINSSNKKEFSLTYKALNNMVASNGFGITIDAETFQHIYDSYSEIQSIVTDFDNDGVHFNTSTDIESSSAETDASDSVETIASRSAEKQMKSSRKTANI